MNKMFLVVSLFVVACGPVAPFDLGGVADDNSGSVVHQNQYGSPVDAGSVIPPDDVDQVCRKHGYKKDEDHDKDKTGSGNDRDDGNGGRPNNLGG